MYAQMGVGDEMINTNSNNNASHTLYKAKKKISNGIVYLFTIVILLAIGYVILYPLMYMISASFRTGESYFDPTISWITDQVTTEHYKVALNALDYWNTLKNTVIYELFSGVIQLFTCALAAYGLARFEFKEKKFLMLLLILIILLPVQMTILPTYVNYSKMDVLGIFGWLAKYTGIDIRPNVLDTPLVFYLPAMFGVGLRSGIIIFIYIQFFKGFPYELEEAAWLDGCTPFATFFKVVLPSSSVVIFTNFIFTIIWHWNDYFLAGMYLKARENFTLAINLSNIINILKDSRLASWSAGSPQAGSIVMAACVLYVLPMLIMYAFLQRKFIKSIDRVGITG